MTVTTADLAGKTDGSGLGTATVTVARRAMLRYLRTPQLMVIGLMQGLSFLLIFRYVFGGAINTGGLRYVDFMVPGIITVSTLFLGMSTAVGVAEDLKQGFFDRLRSLPMPAAAVPTGRAVADTVIVAGIVAVLTAVSVALGFRPHGGAGATLAAFGLVVLFAFAFIWVFIALGMLTDNPQAAQGIGFLVLPLSFASSAYVPVGTMPGWLQAFAEHQPVSVTISAARTLVQGAEAEALLGSPSGYFVSRALLWIVGITVAFVPLAVIRSRRG